MIPLINHANTQLANWNTKEMVLTINEMTDTNNQNAIFIM